jgi:glycerophosphoryl diester phosphodiesterase
MTAINDHEILVIERDNNQGATAAFKRIYMIDLRSVGTDGTVTKELVVDLMAITDRDGLTQTADGALGLGSTFTFPFVTIEDVYPIDAQTLLVVNDNNYPFSSGRRPGKAPDDNEFIVLHLPTRMQLHS